MSQLRVAVVDDNPAVGAAMNRLLKSFDFLPQVYRSGSAFVEDIDGARELDCIVLDLQMPDRSGLDVIQSLSQAGLDIPVIMLTAHDSPNSRDACMSAGAAAYLCKPVDADRLLRTINAAVRPRRVLIDHGRACQ